MAKLRWTLQSEAEERNKEMVGGAVKYANPMMTLPKAR